MGGFAGQIGITVPSHFAALVDADPSLPWLTHYDDASGERTELSGATLANWVAKTANLLVDGLGLGPGDRAAVWLPPHWQTAAVLLGAWTAGLTVAYAEPTAAGADVEFASLEAVEAGAPVGTADRFVLGLAPMGMPLDRDAGRLGRLHRRGARARRRVFRSVDRLGGHCNDRPGRHTGDSR